MRQETNTLQWDKHNFQTINCISLAIRYQLPILRNRLAVSNIWINWNKILMQDSMQRMPFRLDNNFDRTKWHKLWPIPSLFSIYFCFFKKQSVQFLEQKSLLLAFIPSKDPALLNIRSLLGASHPKILHPALAPNLRIPTTAALSIPGLPTPTSIPSAAVSAAGTSLWAAAARRWHDDGP